MHHKIAFVDDDRKILESLNLVFKDAPYHVVLCNSAFEALKIMENEEFSVVVSDLFMPGMKGDVFLQKVMQKHPNTVRIIMTANSSATVTQKNVHQVILKPWSIHQMISVIKDAVMLYEKNYDNPVVTSD
ncbi:MAG: response regulator [Deltaproteobacteria bacterium]|nr:response regulator [Deltaproteobacteria bacterium]